MVIMAILPIDQLKTRFENGDFPRQQDYWDLIDTLNEDAVYFSATAPDDETTYKLWLNTSTERLSVFYNDAWISIGDGADGADGQDGSDGASAYQVAVANGFSGTQQQWLASLIGAAGSNGINGTNGTNGTNGADSTVPGPKGDTGNQGPSGIISVTAPITNTGTSTEANIGINLSAYYTSSQVDSAISAVIDAAPGTLNTLNELAAAINDDASYAATMTAALGNKQDKVSGVSDTEIGYLDGVTSSIQTQINSKQATVTNVSDTEIGYLDGVTSAIQTQINGKAASSHSHAQSDITNLTTDLAAKASLSGSETLTNKRINPRSATLSNGATITIAADSTDFYSVTALAQSTTFASPTGTPVDGQKLTVRVKDNGTARSISWNSIFRGSADLALPTITLASKTMYLGFIYNSADSKWDLVARLGNF
jgi:hypothetical protein